MKYYTTSEAAVLAEKARMGRRSKVWAVLAGFAWGVLAALALLALVGCADIVESPTADYWLDRTGQVVSAEDPGRVVGIRIEAGAASWVGAFAFDPEVTRSAAAVEVVCGVLIPIVTVWSGGDYVPCGGVDNAAGCYHSGSYWDHSWIALTDSWEGTNLVDVRSTAVIHELCHHASGMSDTDEFLLLVAAAKIQYIYWEYSQSTKTSLEAQ